MSNTRLKWHTEVKKLVELKNWDSNPRTITEDNFSDLISSVDELGNFEPLVVDTDGTVIAGNQRLRVLTRLGEMEAEVSVPSRKLTKQEIKKIGLISNRHSGEWNMDKLANEFEDVLTELGFDDLMPEIVEEVEEDDYEEPEDLEVRVKLGEVWQLGKHRLMCGDSTKIEDVEKLMDGQKADMVFTDPPYNVDYEGKTKDALKIENDKFDTSDSFYQFLYDAFTNLFVSTGDGCPIYVCHADSEGLNFRKAFQDAVYLLKQCVIWNKNTMVMGRQDYQWKHEPILYGWKSGEAHKWYGGRNKYTVWDIEKPSRSGEHPTMKPLELVSIAIQNSSKHNDLVLDTFGGSGSTLIACEQTNRVCYMMELDEHYATVILDRWEKLTGKVATKL